MTSPINSRIIKITQPKSSETPLPSLPPWVVLIIDDEQSVHEITKNVLTRFRLQGRGIHFVSAYSCGEAKALYLKHPEAAVALVDCMMEKNTAGLDFIKFVREDQNNRLMQLVLRTGQPNFAPERQVLLDYDINDYLAKSELTSARLHHRMIAYLRTYENLITIDKQNQELVQLDRIKDDLLSVVSHELRSPVSAIDGLLHLIVDCGDQQLSSDNTRYLGLIRAVSKRLGFLINDLIDGAMIKRDEFRMQMSTINMHSLVNETLPMIHMQVIYEDKQSCVAIVNNIAQNCPRVRADEQRIQQVIVNLLGNALKFTDNGSITLSSEVRDSELVVAVEDTGIGMAKDRLSSIFGMFTQIKNPTQRDYEGIGLGLSISKKIIEAHGGRIDADSVLGQGSIFRFTLPLDEAL